VEIRIFIEVTKDAERSGIATWRSPFRSERRSKSTRCKLRFRRFRYSIGWLLIELSEPYLLA